MKLAIPPVVQVVLSLLAMWGVAVFSPFQPIRFEGQMILALLFFAAGVAIIFIAVGFFAKAGTTVDPRDPSKGEVMVTGGIYRISRNPMYLGMAVTLFAMLIWTGQPLNLLIFFIFILYMTWFQIRPEEEFLRTRYGAEFHEYARHVRRWL